MIYGISKLSGTHPLLWAGMGYLGYKSKYDWKITDGPRSNQGALYAQGRDAQGHIVDAAAVVTDAPANSGPHEFGLAIDAYPTADRGKSIILDKNHPAYAERDALLAHAFPGLKSDVVISSGPDKPHIEVRDWQAHKNWKPMFAGFVLVGTVCTLALLFANSP